MKIRKYQKKDKIKVGDMILSVLKNIYKNPLPEWEDFSKYLIFYVAEEKRNIIGTIALKKVDNDWAKLKRMYVKKEFQNKGIGGKLLEKVITLAKKKGFKKIILTTYPEMKKAVPFYKKRGFKVVKKPSGKFFTNPKLKKYNKRQIAMEKEL